MKTKFDYAFDVLIFIALFVMLILFAGNLLKQNETKVIKHIKNGKVVGVDTVIIN